MNRFKGVGVALVTPFDGNGDVDYTALGALLDHTEKVDFYVVLGTTAESATLSAQERDAVVRYVVKHNAGRRPIVVGIGGNNTSEVVRMLGEFNLEGVDAILSVVPYYNKPTQGGIYAHYAAVLEASPLPVILYNVPGRTGVNMAAETTLRLANDFPKKAVAVKEASGNMSQVAYILRDRPQGFLVLSGDDNLTLPILAMGGDGVISVSANAFPSKMSSMVRFGLSGGGSVASSLSLEMWEATDLLFREGNPAGVKMALAIKNIMGAGVRLPLVEASDELREQLTLQIEKYGL
ncbi:MAG: 4-hydroxy-tetrahydrodipicolinate synthase [Rikenellaceae bacterium]